MEAIQTIAVPAPLKLGPIASHTTVDEVFGMLKYDGPPVSIRGHERSDFGGRSRGGMRAVDTNVIVRYLTNDDAEQRRGHAEVVA